MKRLSKLIILVITLLCVLFFAACTKGCDVTFDSMGGSDVVNRENIKSGSKITPPSDPEKTGYEFEKWYKDAACVDEWNFYSDIVTENITLYAKWTPVTYAITYANLSGGTHANPATYTVESGEITFEDPSGREGYTGSWDIPEMQEGSTGDVTVTAVWTPVNYSITYALGTGGENHDDNPYVYNIGSEINLKDPTRIGYTFDCWTENGSVSTGIAEGSTGDKIFVASWTAKKYSLTVTNDNPQAGTASNASGSYDFGTSVTLTAAINAGYTFLGWYDGDINVSTDLSYTFTIPADDMAVTAKWVACPVTLTQNLTAAGSVGGIERTVLGAHTVITAITNAGYTWLGWYEGQTLLTTNSSYTFIMPENAKTFTAVWGSYFVTLNQTINGGVSTFGGSIYGGGQVVAGMKTTVFAISNEGYDWLGWYEGGELVSTDQNYSFVMPYKSITLTAAWKVTGLSGAGTGTEYDPFIITTKEQFINFADQVNSGQSYAGIYFALGADISLDDMEWTPIGENALNKFAGNFDGRLFTVKNFKITASAKYAGLFGYSSGNIKKLGVTDFIIDNIASGICVGGLMGYNYYGTIFNCYTTGSVNVSSNSDQIYAGNLLGYNFYGTVTASYATGSISAASTFSADVGGLVGINAIGNITDCYSTGCVSAAAPGSARAGGLIGDNYGGTVKNCYSIGSVSASAVSSIANAGGLIGHNNGAVSYSYATGNVSASSKSKTANAGGLVGYSIGTTTTCFRYAEQVFSRQEGSNTYAAANNTIGGSVLAGNFSAPNFYVDSLGWNCINVWAISGDATYSPIEGPKLFFNP